MDFFLSIVAMSCYFRVQYHGIVRACGPYAVQRDGSNFEQRNYIGKPSCTRGRSDHVTTKSAVKSLSTNHKNAAIKNMSPS